jgi:hypothetical protein
MVLKHLTQALIRMTEPSFLCGLPQVVHPLDSPALCFGRKNRANPKNTTPDVYSARSDGIFKRVFDVRIPYSTLSFWSLLSEELPFDIAGVAGRSDSYVPWIYGFIRPSQDGPFQGTLGAFRVMDGLLFFDERLEASLNFRLGDRTGIYPLFKAPSEGPSSSPDIPSP